MTTQLYKIPGGSILVFKSHRANPNIYWGCEPYADIMFDVECNEKMFVEAVFKKTFNEKTIYSTSIPEFELILASLAEENFFKLHVKENPTNRIKTYYF